MEDMLTASERKSLQMDEKQAQHGSCSGDCEKVDSHEVAQGVLGDLPEVCIAMILSCLPPREVAKLACVCRSFRSASNFDSVWENILPPKYKDSLALDPDAVPARFASKREIFDYLCNPMIFANNTQAFWIDRDTGGVCRSIAARGIRITWGDDRRYWDWVPDHDSVFPEIARLKNVCWFEAKGEMEFSLPPGAYTFTWRLYLADLQGWDDEPAHFSLLKNDAENFECKCYIDHKPDVTRRLVQHFRLPTVRVLETGWSEYDVGEFTVEKREETCFLKFCMVAIQRGTWKSGLLMDGIVIRPTETVRRIPSITSPRAESGFHTPEFQPEGPEFRFPEVLRRFFTSLPTFSRAGN